MRLPGTAVVGNPQSTPKPAAGWDRLVDPEGDCQFREEKGKLTITFPRNKVHDLTVERGKMNALCLLRDIEGDFTAEVHVGGFQDRGTQAAGLLLMVNDNTYLRLERGRFGGTVSFWELRRDGRKVPSSTIMKLSVAEGYVRLERRGGRVFGFLSDDGEKWTERQPFDIDLPQNVQIGVAAISMGAAFEPTFDRFQLRQGKGKWVRIEKWLGPPRTKLAWQPPTDPDGDCKFKEDNGKLTITVPAKAHLLNVEGNAKNSPRLLSDIEGDFTVQVRVGGDFAFGAATTDGGGLSWIGAGLLLWGDDNTFLRLERAKWAGRPDWPSYANWEVCEGGKVKPPKLNFKLSAAETYLRLERRGKQIRASYSEDGQNWNKVTWLDIALPAKVKIGVLVGTNTARPFAPTFDQFQLKQGQGEMARIDWPPMPGGKAVVKPPRRPRPVRSSNRTAVPDEATLADKQKEVRVMYRDDYKGKSKRGLASRLLEDGKRQNDMGLRYVMLNEACDLAAQDGALVDALRRLGVSRTL